MDEENKINDTGDTLDEQPGVTAEAEPSDEAQPEIIAETEPAEDSQPETVAETEPAAGDSDGGAGNNKKIIIAAIIAVAAIAAIVAVIFIVRGAKTGGKPEEISSETANDIFEDLTNSEGSVLSDEEINSKLEEERDPELISMIENASKKFTEEVGTGSTNEIVPAKKEHASTPTANGDNQGAASATAANGGNQGSSETATATTPATEPSGDNNTADKEQADAAITQIKAFYDRKCYFEGKMFENGEGTPMSIAFDGDNYEVFTQLDGIEISIMKKDGKFYMKRPAAKQYVELNDSLMSMVGLSMDDINVNFGSKDFNSLSTESVYDVTINGQQGVCYQYKAADTEGTDNDVHSYFYAVDGNLKEIDITSIDKKSGQKTTTQLQIDVFSTTIPSDQLNVNGYTQAKSLFSMLSDMMT